MRILVVEDNETLAALVEKELTEQGYTVDVCGDGEDGLYWLLKGVYDLVLLDRMLPGLDGLELLRRGRGAGVASPVIMLTALDGLQERCEGLDGGADDYLAKPFAMDELLARVRALLRRPRGMEEPGLLRFEGLTLNRGEKTLQCSQRRCSLSKRETELLELFLRNPNKVLSRPRIFEYVWGPDAPVEEANLDNYIHFVRLRLKEVATTVQIRTIRSVGYQLVAQDVS